MPSTKILAACTFFALAATPTLAQLSGTTLLSGKTTSTVNCATPETAVSNNHAKNSAYGDYHFASQDKMTPELRTQFRKAMDKWNGTPCNKGGNDFPYLREKPQSGQDEYKGGPSGSDMWQFFFNYRNDVYGPGGQCASTIDTGIVFFAQTKVGTATIDCAAKMYRDDLGSNARKTCF